MLTKKKMKQSYDLIISRLDARIKRLAGTIEEMSSDFYKKYEALQQKCADLNFMVENPKGCLSFSTNGEKTEVFYHYFKNNSMKHIHLGKFDAYYSEDDDGRYDPIEKFSYIKDTKEDIATIVIGDKTFYIDLV